MGTVYQFDYQAWGAQFPEFGGVSEAAANGYFAMAALYVRNDGSGPINGQPINGLGPITASTPTMQAALLNLTTAHLAKLFSNQNDAGAPQTGGGQPPNSTVVGRVASAGQGSVNVATEMPDQPASAAWWNQTQYGASAWKMMAPFRTMRYIGPFRRRVFNPPGRYWGGGFGGF